MPDDMMLKRSDVLVAIADEPEFPGEIPDEYWLRLKVMVEQNDREGITELFRISVRLAKADIAERVKAL